MVARHRENVAAFARNASGGSNDSDQRPADLLTDSKSTAEVYVEEQWRWLEAAQAGAQRRFEGVRGVGGLARLFVWRLPIVLGALVLVCACTALICPVLSLARPNMRAHIWRCLDGSARHDEHEELAVLVSVMR